MKKRSQDLDAPPETPAAAALDLAFCASVAQRALLPNLARRLTAISAWIAEVGRADLELLAITEGPLLTEPAQGKPPTRRSTDSTATDGAAILAAVRSLPPRPWKFVEVKRASGLPHARVKQAVCALLAARQIEARGRGPGTRYTLAGTVPKEVP